MIDAYRSENPPNHEDALKVCREAISEFPDITDLYRTEIGLLCDKPR